MNRRSLFSFAAAAPLGVLATNTEIATPDRMPPALEYLAISPRAGDNVTDALNKVAREGWTLVEATPGYGSAIYIFARVKRAEGAA